MKPFGWDRFGFGFGPQGFFWSGPRGRRRRWFESGDMKYVILKLLKDKPRHGYEVMKELQEQLHGCYSPSPGTVYPTLQWLRGRGVGERQGGRGEEGVRDHRCGNALSRRASRRGGRHLRAGARRRGSHVG